MKRRWIVALLVVVTGVSVYVGNVLATPGSGLTTIQLAKSTVDQLNINAHTLPADMWQTRIQTHGLSDVYVVDNTLAPGGTTGWHSHPGPSLILVVKGTITNYLGDDPTCTPHTYSQGSAFVDPEGTVHTLRNETSASAETIAVQFLPQGAPRKIDAPVAPGNCPF